MGSIEDHYQSIERQKKFSEIETRMRQYNENVDTVRRLTPKILNGIIANPPDRYKWIVLNGKKCISWDMLDQSDQERSADQTINLLEGGALVTVRLIENDWVAIAPVVLEHISFDDERAQSDYHGGCGYLNGDRNGEKPLGSWTLSSLSYQMRDKAVELGIDPEGRATRTPSSKPRKGLFGFLFS